jgi:hypothetical protein
VDNLSHAFYRRRNGLRKHDTWEFSSREELIAQLKRRDWRGDFKAAHKKENFGPLSAIYRSVSGNTFRAFRKNKDWSPSGVFGD